ncbi:MAG: hypothetical protein KJ737_06255 [Proteobacteria bacterium]|nr:hypothetical protein [Pseudomonadota bacterium]
MEKYEKAFSLLTHARLPVILSLLAMFISLPGLFTGFKVDDYIHRIKFMDSSAMDNPINGFRLFGMFSWQTKNHAEFLQQLDRGDLPWWTYEGLRISFWRPLAEITHWLDYQFLPDSPEFMLFHNLLWFGAVVLVVSIFFRRIMGITHLAGLAGLLYALDHTHFLNVSWIAARNSMIATFFGVSSLIAHDRLIKDTWKAGYIIAPVCLILSLLSAEYGVVTIFYIFSYSVFIDNRRLKDRALSLLPYMMVTITWRIFYTIGRFGSFGSMTYIDPAKSPLEFISVLHKRLPVMFQGEWGISPSTFFILPEAVKTPMWFATLVLSAIGLTLIFPLLRTDNKARFWFTGFFLSSILMCAAFSDDRLFIFTGMGAVALLAQLIFSWHHNAPWLPNMKFLRILTNFLVIILIAVHLFLSPLLFSMKMMIFNNFTQKMYHAPAMNLGTQTDYTDKDLVLINPVDALQGIYFLVTRMCYNLSIPMHLRVLFAGLNNLKIMRTDPQTLVVEPEGGYFSERGSTGFRDQLHPLQKGKRIELTGLTIEILSLTTDGRPEKVAFHFKKAFDDPSLIFLKWHSGRYVRFEPPDIGTFTRLKGE